MAQEPGIKPLRRRLLTSVDPVASRITGGVRPLLVRCAEQLSFGAAALVITRMPAVNWKHILSWTEQRFPLQDPIEFSSAYFGIISPGFPVPGGGQHTPNGPRQPQ